ncbi:MAG: 5-oxoprolinase subunit PxpB, partial [Lachnospiraceae bacterium]|nr:5-oxoprolinase subunit PxpB [Lachnospiraceae bacterium]
AAHNGKTVEEVIKIHTSEEYLIYMLGFIAGFPYLGGMSKEIATPRLASPRVKIEGGSVGIAGEQTGIYPVASPGGWQLIGRTPLKMYDADREKPVLLEAGQYIKFVSVTEEEYKKIEKQVEENTYKYVTYAKKEVE